MTKAAEVTNLPTVQKPRDIRVVSDQEPIMDTGRFEHMQRIASVMARCALVPTSLRGDDIETAIANCFLVVNQAVRWGMDPFAVAQCSSVIQGKLCYEGKLVSAVMQNNGVNLSFKFNDKTGDALEVTVSGKLPNEDEARTVSGTVGQWKTNNQQWSKDPKAMLCYRGSRAWSRIHNPAPMLGVYTQDEMEEAPPATPALLPPDPPGAETKTETPPVDQTQAGATTSDKPKRTRKPRTTKEKMTDIVVLSDEQWLKDLDGSFSGCEEASDLFAARDKYMQPQFGKVSRESWAAAEKVLSAHLKRINEAAEPEPETKAETKPAPEAVMPPDPPGATQEENLDIPADLRRAPRAAGEPEEFRKWVQLQLGACTVLEEVKVLWEKHIQPELDKDNIFPPDLADIMGMFKKRRLAITAEIRP